MKISFIVKQIHYFVNQFIIISHKCLILSFLREPNDWISFRTQVGNVKPRTYYFMSKP